MIHVDQALCAGCGVCVDECPSGAIMLDDDVALVAPALCDGCGACVEICPTGALTQVAEPVPADAVELPLLPVVQPSVEVVPAETRGPTPWRRTVLPAVGGGLVWVGREIVPRLATLALDALDGALNRRSSIQRGRWSRDEGITPAPAGRRRGRGRRERRRRRRGRPPS